MICLLVCGCSPACSSFFPWNSIASVLTSVLEFIIVFIIITLRCVLTPLSPLLAMLWLCGVAPCSLTLPLLFLGKMSLLFPWRPYLVPGFVKRLWGLVIVRTSLLKALKSFLKVPTCFYHHFFFIIKCSPSKAWIIEFPHLQGTLDYILPPLLL